MKIDEKVFNIMDDGGAARRFLIIGTIGTILSILGLVVDSRQFFQSYLTAYSFWLTISLGCLFFVMLHHLTNATWSIIVRRIAENAMIALIFAIIFFIPVIIGSGSLYEWSHPDIVAGDAILKGKSGYLNIGFFIVRSLVYFAVWSILSVLLMKYSTRQDFHCSPELTKKMRITSAIGMLLFAITITFASFDWLMSLDPHWYSTIFGVYIFGGGFLTALALISFYAIKFKSDVLKTQLGPNHFHDLGKMLFAFAIFWAYIAFSQYFLIWYGNIPEETIWYHHRWHGGWKAVSLILVFGSFIIPFIVLMSKGAKKNLRVMNSMVILFLIVHWIDIFWVIAPNFKQDGILISWMDAASMMGTGGFYLWFMNRRLRHFPIIPLGDTRLNASIKMGNN